MSMTRDKIEEEFEEIYNIGRFENISAANALNFAQHIAELAISREREVCAKLCEKLDNHPDHLHPGDCAEAIRSHIIPDG